MKTFYLFVMILVSCGEANKSTKVVIIDSVDAGADSSDGNPISSCNNGQLDTNEICEGFELRDQTCSTQGFETGILSCSSACVLDTSQCSTCGDGVLQGMETCDKDAFDGRRCEDERGSGYTGELTCVDCKSINSDKCQIIFSAVESGIGRSCAIGSDGSVRCWGKKMVTPRTTNLPLKSLSMGEDGICAIRKEGTQENTIECWNSNIISDVAPLGEFEKIGTGRKHACGIRRDGTIKCWGANGSGQSSPPFGTFKEIASGGDYSCAITEDGSLKCWGREGIQPKYFVPSGIFKAVSLGFDSGGCVLNQQNKLQCWGRLPDPPDVEFASFSIGGGFGCGVLNDGKALCWGGSTFGFDGVPPQDSFLKISSGINHACGLTQVGTVECWGKNREGQLDVATF